MLKLRSAMAAAGLMAVLCAATPALAAPCAGFADVDETDDFCANVAWIKNRGVTQGCAVGLYCPAANVTRLQMAAFMSRLGEALHATFLHQVESGAAAEFNAAQAMCVTASYPVTGFPRTATGTGSVYFGGAALSASLGQIRLVYSADGGSWLSFADFYMPASVEPGRFNTATSVARPLGLEVGTSVRFAILNHNAGAVVSDAGCEITVRIEGRGEATLTDPLPGEDAPQQ